MSQLVIVAAVLGAFTLKMIAVGGGAVMLRRYMGDRLEAWLAAWITIQMLTMLYILAMSPFNLVNRTSMWTWLLVLGALFSYPLWRDRAAVGMKIRRRLTLSDAFMFLIFIVFCVRSLTLFDYTGDGFNYEYPRLGIWMHTGSVLVHMPTPQINIFTSEWNGEINGLIYGLASGDIQGLGFGNAEVLGLAFLSAFWLALRFGASGSRASAVALVVVATPACLGLAATVKGDLLACVGTMLAVGWIVTPGDRNRRALSIAFGIAALGLAVGSKISSTIGCVLLALVLLATILPQVKSAKTWLGIGCGTVFALILCARFLANLAIYGDPLSRVRGEKITFSLSNLLGNMQVSVERWFGFFPDQPPFSTWALSGGLGLTGVLVLVSAMLSLDRPSSSQKTLANPASSAIAVCCLGILFTMVLILPNSWSFRYFLPLVCVVVIAIFCLPKPEWTWRLSWLLPAAAMVNFVSVLRPGEIFPNYPTLNIESNLKAMGQMHSIERALLFHPGTFARFGVAELDPDVASNPRKVAVFSEVDSFLFQFIGSYAQNSLLLAETPAELSELLGSERPDVLILTRRDGILNDAVLSAVAENGYVLGEPMDIGNAKKWVGRPAR